MTKYLEKYKYLKDKNEQRKYKANPKRHSDSTERLKNKITFNGKPYKEYRTERNKKRYSN